MTNLFMKGEYVVELVYQHMYGFAVQAGFYGDVVKCLISDPVA